MCRLGLLALLSVLAATGLAVQSYALPQHAFDGGGPVPLIWVHHEASENAPPAQMLTSLPADDWLATNWYKQSIYDLQDNRLGEIVDWLIDHDGKNTTALIGVGGFIGVAEKVVAVPFDAVRFKKKDNTWYAVLNTTNHVCTILPVLSGRG